MNKLVRRLRDAIKVAYDRHQRNKNLREWEKLVRKREENRRRCGKADNIL